MRLAAAGDVMLGRNVGARLAQRMPADVWGETLPWLREADASIVNLECVIARAGTGAPWPDKVFHFTAPPETLAVLRAARVSMVTLANNHTLDYGRAALEEMLDLLAEAGIPGVGAGRDAEEAGRPRVLETGGVRVAVLNFTDNEPDWEAGAQRAGVCYVPTDITDRRAVALRERIRAARAAHDLVVVAAHWGPNMVPEPLPGHRPFARALAEAGADLFLGTSAHVVQGIELYRPEARPERIVPICYDLGDYVDDYAVNPRLRNDLSFLFTFEIDRAGVHRIELLPVRIDGWQGRVDAARGPDTEETLGTMVARCRKAGTAVARTADTLVVDVAA